VTRAQLVLVSIIGIAAFAALLQTNAIRRQLVQRGTLPQAPGIISI
jgi:hypothetical protein